MQIECDQPSCNRFVYYVKRIGALLQIPVLREPNFAYLKHGYMFGEANVANSSSKQH